MTGDAELALELHRGDPRMVGGDQVGRPEPQPQRRLGVVHLLVGEALLELHDRQWEARPRHPATVSITSGGTKRVCTSVLSLS